MIFKENRGTHIDILTYLEQIFPSYHKSLVFSGRQGLDIIYHHLYSEYGSLSVAVSPLTCFEALYPIINNKHTIRFVDINQYTLNMDEDFIPDDVDAIQPIHLGGNPQNMDKIISSSKTNGQIVIEDCAQAFGASYNNQLLGTFGDYSIFSLMKNLFALGGGLILSRKSLPLPNYKPLGKIPTYYRVLKRSLESRNTINSHFINSLLYSLICASRTSNQEIFFKENTINNRIISSIFTQLKNSKYLIEKRIQNAEYIKNNISNCNFVPQLTISGGKMNYTRLFFVIETDNLIATIKKMRKLGISANHLTQDSLNYYQNSVFENPHLRKYTKNCDLFTYKDLHNKIISLPISPNLSENEIRHIITCLNTI